MVTMFDRRRLPWRAGWNQKFGIILKGLKRAINSTSQKSRYSTLLGTPAPNVFKKSKFFENFQTFSNRKKICDLETEIGLHHRVALELGYKPLVPFWLVIHSRKPRKRPRTSYHARLILIFASISPTDDRIFKVFVVRVRAPKEEDLMPLWWLLSLGCWDNFKKTKKLKKNLMLDQFEKTIFDIASLSYWVDLPFLVKFFVFRSSTSSNKIFENPTIHSGNWGKNVKWWGGSCRFWIAYRAS